MNSTLVVVLFVCITLWPIFNLYRLHKQIESMIGMTAAMIIGMTFGMGMGAYLSFIYPNQIFAVTMSVILIGAFMGMVAGFPFGLIAILEGLLAGIMGGMMGAMLTMMIPSPYSDPTIKIMSVLLSSILFLLQLLIRQEIRTRTTLPFFITLLIFFFILHQTQFMPPSTHDYHSSY